MACSFGSPSNHAPNSGLACSIGRVRSRRIANRRGASRPHSFTASACTGTLANSSMSASLAGRTGSTGLVMAKRTARRLRSDGCWRWRRGGCSGRGRRARPSGRRTAAWSRRTTSSSSPVPGRRRRPSCRRGAPDRRRRSACRPCAQWRASPASGRSRQATQARGRGVGKRYGMPNQLVELGSRGDLTRSSCPGCGSPPPSAPSSAPEPR